MTITDITTFANQLFDQGIELALRRNTGRLYLSPKGSLKLLSLEQQNFLENHLTELTEFVSRGLQPKLPDDAASVSHEARVTSSTPESGPDGPLPDAPIPDPEANGNKRRKRKAESGPHCPYCGDRECVGPKDKWFKVLHWRDPEEQQRRDTERRERDVHEWKMTHRHRHQVLGH